ncbi:MAG: glycosyltransferase, partial [Candidatus Saccharibacteria bacterium]
WTEWTPGSGKMPQVWLSGHYGFRWGHESFNTDETYRAHAIEFLRQLTVPGVYEVGGLGACTLISRKAIEHGVSFGCVKNVDYWGEDRHFCIRATVLGIGLYVDTHYPAYHIYRESDLVGVEEYRLRVKGDMTLHSTKHKASGNKLTLSMIVHNEAERYLRQVLEHARQYIDNAVIIDDASTDDTVKICREALAGIPLTIIELKHPLFKTENILRKIQWEETIKTNPDWILSLDADEIFEDRLMEEIQSLINQDQFDVFYFRLYDFWDQNHYREDTYWQAHNSYRPLLVRYIPDYEYVWKETALHCGRLPLNITALPGAASSLRIKHLGWAQPADREAKYKRYMESDPEGKYGIMEQYQSILDPEPNLVKWEE